MYTRELEYTLFLAERSIEDAKNMAYIQECLVLAEGVDVVNRITAIQEGVVDKAKLALKKVQEWIKNVWAKFMEKFNKLAMDDAKYLQEYKEIIFKRQPLDATYTMFDYPVAIKRCTEVKVPKLDYNAMEASLKKDAPGEFLQRYVPALAKDYDGKGDVQEYIRTYFKGGTSEPKEIPVSQLKFADMYDFCVEYKKILNIVETDKKVIEASYNDAMKALENVPPSPSNEEKQTNESTIDRFFGGNKTVYSSVYETYITEEEKDKTNGTRVLNGQGNKTDNTVPNAQSGTKVSDNIKSTDVADATDSRTEEEKKKETTTAMDKQRDEAGALKSQEIIDKINLYNTICTSIMSAKLSTVQDAKATYMKILRTHIKDHVGNSDSTSGNNSARTNYDNGNNPYDKSSDGSKDKARDYITNTLKLNATADQINDFVKGTGTLSARQLGEIRGNDAAKSFISQWFGSAALAKIENAYATRAK